MLLINNDKVFLLPLSHQHSFTKNRPLDTPMTHPYCRYTMIMAIKRLKDKNGKPGKWELTTYPPGKGGAGLVRKRFNTKSEAEAWEAEFKRSFTEGRDVDSKAAKQTTVAALWEMFRQHIEVHGVRGNGAPRQKTLDNYDFKYRNYIEQEWQHTPVASVSRERCTAWITGMTNAAGESVSNDARKDATAVFRNMLDFGLNRGLLSYNPMKDRAGKALPIPAVEDRRANVYLTLRQLYRLASVSGNAGLIILTSGLTGLRRGEVIGTKVRDVELGNSPSVFIPKDRSKTREARTVPLPRQLADLIEATGIAEWDLDAPAFPAAQGGFWSESYLGKVFRPAAALACAAISSLQEALGMDSEYTLIGFDDDRARVAIYGEATERAVRAFQKSHGLDPSGAADSALWDALKLPNLSPVALSYRKDLEPDRDAPAVPVFHDLRHTAVSLAIRSGVSIKMVQKMAGHASAMVTLDVYGHLYPEDVETAAEAMTTLIGSTFQHDLATATQ